MKFLYNWCN